jgi:putative transcriptional regulator
MAKRTKARKKTAPRGKARMRAEIVEATRGLHKIGAVSEDELTKTTLRMLGKNALPRVEPMSPSQIVAVRKQTGVSQAVMAAFLNVAVSTISQWERGERHPTGAALKLLHVVRQNGIEALG